jgi:hypothetical protein
MILEHVALTHKNALRCWPGAFLIVVAFLPGSLYGQWATCGSGQCITSGNVGIGTTSPEQTLDVEGPFGFGYIARFGQNTSGGILFNNGTGTGGFAPEITGLEQGDQIALSLSGHAASDLAGDLPVVTIDARSASGYIINRPLWGVGNYISSIWQYKLLLSAAGNLGVGAQFPINRVDVAGGAAVGGAYAGTNAAPSNGLIVQGQVGIGTFAPCLSSGLPQNCMLSVAGAVQAKEVVVDTGWSDYVFAPDYRLVPLSDVAAYVRKNGHLPEIPSAKQVQEEGVNLGEMQSKLLAKIEELTLHMIEAEERADRLESQNRMLQERVIRLEAKKK